MANTIAKQTLIDDERHLVVKVQITGDNSGEESATMLINVSEYNGFGDYFNEVSIKRVHSAFDGFTATLLWDADSDVKIVTLPNDLGLWDFCDIGGLPNNAGVGKTGDILINTTGLGTEEGTVLLEMIKRNRT